MSKHALMNTLRTASIINRPVSSFGLESSEDINSELNEALESIARLQRNYDGVTNFYKSVASLESADYTNIIFNSATAIITGYLKGSGLSAQETPALEAMSFNMTGIINNAKNAASAIWKKICEWCKTLFSKLDSFMVNYRNGFDLIAKRAHATGNAILKGELIQVTKQINSDDLSHPIGLLPHPDVTSSFFGLKHEYGTLVGDPLISAYSILKPLIESLELNSNNGVRYERDLLRAIKVILNLFTQAAPSGVARESILPGAKFTNNIFAGARLMATDLTKVDNFTTRGFEVSYTGTIDMVLEKATSPQLIEPVTARNMLRIAAELTDKNNPWVQNKDGGNYLSFADELLKTLNSVTSKFPDEQTVDLARRILIAYTNCVVMYNAAMYKLYKHAVLTMNAVITASSAPAKKP